jgi:TATA-box binding protein (TBP) (component of TFIID and TFIIIB)
MGFVHARNIVLPNRTPNTGSVKVTVALFESGCIIITGSIMPEDAQVVRQYIIDKLKAEGEKRTSPRKILKSSWLASSSVTGHRSLQLKALCSYVL